MKSSRVAVAAALVLGGFAVAPTTAAWSSNAQPTPPMTRSATTVPVAASTLPDWLLGHDWQRIPTTRKIVALTFDAGGNAAGVTSILATLQARGVKATFFLTGNWTKVFPTKARAIVAAGHLVGNHSMTHPDFTTLTDDQMRAQLAGCWSAVKGTTGVIPKPFFRFPYGARNAHTIAVVNGRDYVPIRWTVDTLGWQGTSGGQTADSVYQRVVAALRPGEIVLMHVGANPTDHSTLDAAALPRVIDALRSQGYRFVTMRALTG